MEVPKYTRLQFTGPDKYNNNLDVSITSVSEVLDCSGPRIT